MQIEIENIVITGIDEKDIKYIQLALDIIKELKGFTEVKPKP